MQKYKYKYITKINLVQSQRPRCHKASRCATCSAGWGGTSREAGMQTDGTSSVPGTSGSACHIRTSVGRRWLNTQRSKIHIVIDNVVHYVLFKFMSF